MGISFNTRRLNRAINAAWEQTAQAYALQCNLEIEDPQWDWNGETTRSDGSIAGSPRDAVDTGDLINSQQPVRLEVRGGEIIAVIEWDSDHAAVVHEGRGDIDYPARPFTKTALQNLNITKRFAKSLKGEL